MKTNIIDCLVRNATLDEPKGITLINSEEREEYLSYAELLYAGRRVLYHLQQHGIDKGMEVVLQLEDNKLFLISFWACVLGCIIPVPLSVESKAFQKQKLVQVWKKLNRPFLITSGKQLEDIRDIATNENLPALLSDILLAEDFPLSGPLADIDTITGTDIAFIQFSSGSTGDPKGVILTHDNLIVNTSDIISASAIDNSSTSLSWMPLTHDMGMICFHLSSLVANIHQYLVPTPLFVRRPVIWISKTSEHRITHLYSPNFGYHYLLQALERLPQIPDWDLSSVKLIYNGAEPISHEICHRFVTTLGAQQLDANVIFPGYGLAEASVVVTLSETGQPLQVLHLDRSHLDVGAKISIPEKEQNTVSFVGVGYPIEHCEVRICNDTDTLLAPEHIGHIQIRGGNVTAGYYNDKARSEELFTTDGWLRTGDLGFFSQDRLFITGRKKNIIIINGQNYYPQDIERAVEKIDGLEPGKVVACGVQDATGSQTSLVIFLLFKGPLTDFLTLAQKVKKNIADAVGLIADEVLPVRKIPKTTSGKIRNFDLVRQFQDGEFDTIRRDINALYKTGDNAKEKLTAIWERLFGTAPEPDASFIQLGLNSLQAMALLNEVKAGFNIHLSVKDLFAYSSVNQLAVLLEQPETGIHPVISYEPVPGQLIANEGVLLPMQRKFWYMHQLNQESKSALNISLSVSIKGNLDITALTVALDRLIARHECLRSVFPLTDIGPVQKIVSANSCIEIADLTEEQAEQWLQVKADQPFDLTTAPLMRCVIARYNKDNYLLSLIFHHLVADGWSLSLFTKELTADYNQLVAGIALPDLQMAPAVSGFISWYSALPDKYLQQDVTYWTKQLSGGLTQATLPVYNDSINIHSFRGAQVSVYITNDVRAALENYCQQQQATLFMGLLTVLRTLLFRYSGQSEVHIGTNTSGRSSIHLEQMAGCLLNQAIVKVGTNTSDVFSSLLQKVRSQVIDALHHQTLYLDDLLAGSETSAPDVFIIFQNFSELPGFEEMQKSGLKIAPHEIAITSTPANLIFEFIREANGELRLNLRYNTALIDSKPALALAQHFAVLCAGAVAHPDTPLQELPMLSDNERNELISWGKGAQRDDAYESAISRIAVWAFEEPDALAVISTDSKLSYKTLMSRVDAVAFFLMENGVHKGDCVGSLIPRSAEAIAVMLGIMKAGATYLPIDASYPLLRIQHILKDADCRYLFADTHMEQATVFSVDEAFATIPHTSFATPDLLPDDSAYIIYTSGSTGTPKGVMISHGSLQDYTITFARYFAVSATDIMLHQAPVAFDIAIEEVFPLLISGGSVVVAEAGGRDIEALSDLVISKGVTMISTTPLVISELNKKAAALTALRVLISGGDKLQPAYIDNLLPIVSVYNTYGPTETTVCATYHRVHHLSDASVLGKPIENRSVFILNEHGDLQVTGGAGEIYLGGKGLALEYVNDPQKTASSFITSRFNGERLYRTGDIGKWNANGELCFLGRRDEQVKLNGYRVELSEIERALQRIPGVSDAVVVKTKQQRIYGFYVADSIITPDALSTLLPVYMMPTQLIAVLQIPQTGSGKVDQKALLSLVEETTVTTAARNEIENEILRCWSTVLEHEISSIDTNFFEYGGNSISATRVLQNLERLLHVEINLSDLFMYPTVRLLMAAMAGRSFKRNGLTKAPARIYDELSYAQKRMWLLEQRQGEENAYVITATYKVTGPLDIATFSRAMDIVIARHDMLRTTFAEVEGDIMQQVYPVAPAPFQIEEIRSEPVMMKELKSEIYRQLQQRFDLSSWPLMRIVVYRFSDDEQVLFFNIHHIICDGLSMNILAEELFRTYYELKAGKEVCSTLSEFGYRDYIYWQQEMVTGATGIESRRYWHQKIADTPPLLHHFSTVKPNAGGATVLNIWPTHLSEKIHEFTSRYGVTSYNLLLSVVKVLLFTYTKGQPLITVGSPFSGRTSKELEPMVGLFLNNIVLQTRLDSRDTFTGLLEKVKKEVLLAMKHQQYPYDKLVDELQGHLTSTDNPFYEVLVVHQEDRLMEIFNSFDDNAGKLNLQDLRIYNPISKLGLSFFFREAGNRFTIEIEYSTRLFDEELINRLSKNLLVFTESVLNTPDIRLEDLRALSQNEMEKEEHRSFEDAALISIDDSF